jgi:hypothetical protein
VTLIVSGPGGRLEVVSEAVLVSPPVGVRVALPSEDPLKNVTDPAGADEVPVSVTVNVTGCPKTEGFDEEPIANVGPEEDPPLLQVYVTIENGARVSPPDPQL